MWITLNILINRQDIFYLRFEPRPCLLQLEVE